MTEPNSQLRLVPKLVASARAIAKRMSRSLSQQISHWARFGRESEHDPGVSLAAVQAVLDYSGDYDALNHQEQAIVRASWSERMDKARAGLRLDRLLPEQGREVIELDADGAVVVRTLGGRRPKHTAR